MTEFEKIEGRVSDLMTSAGYRRNGSLYKKKLDDNVALVQRQKSRDSSQYLTKFTYNLAIACPILIDDYVGLKSIKMDCASLSIRIGHVIPINRDIWWVAGTDSGSEGLIEEVVLALSKYGIPYLQQYSSYEGFLNICKSGICPGNSESGRVSLITKLERALKGE